MWLLSALLEAGVIEMGRQPVTCNVARLTQQQEHLLHEAPSALPPNPVDAAPEEVSQSKMNEAAPAPSAPPPPISSSSASSSAPENAASATMSASRSVTVSELPPTVVVDDPKHPPVFHEEFVVAVSVVPKPRDRYTKDEAATKIQSLHRGHAERKRHAERMERRRQEAHPQGGEERAIDDAEKKENNHDHVEPPPAEGGAGAVSSPRYSHDEAATKIQAVHRGHMERKRHKQRMQTHLGLLDVVHDEGEEVPDLDDAEAAGPVNNDDDGGAGPPIEGTENPVPSGDPEPIDDKDDSRSRRDVAATKIQSLHRGHMARKQHKARRDQRDALLEQDQEEEEERGGKAQESANASPREEQQREAEPATEEKKTSEDDAPSAEEAAVSPNKAEAQQLNDDASALPAPAALLTPAKPKGYQTHLVYRRRRDASPNQELTGTLGSALQGGTMTQTQGTGVLADAVAAARTDAAAAPSGAGPEGHLKPIVPRKPGILPGISRHKPVRVDDPIVAALEAKIRERRQRDRQREDETRRKQEAIREAFEKRQQEIELENQRRKAEQLRIAKEAAERRAEEMKELERQRQERLSKMLKADMDVITGRKNIVDAFQQRFEQQQAQIEQERQEALRRRHQQLGARGPDFYRDIKEHEQRVAEELEARRRQLEERRMQAQEAERGQSPFIAADPSHVTRAHRRILAEKKQRQAEEQADEERIRARIHYAKDYAEDIRHKRAPKPREPPRRAPSKKRVLSDAFKDLGVKRKESNGAIKPHPPPPRNATNHHEDDPQQQHDAPEEETFDENEMPNVTSTEDVNA